MESVVKPDEITSEALFPIGDNSNKLDGAWFLWFDHEGTLCSNSIVFNGDSFSFTGNYHNDDGSIRANSTPWFQRCNFTITGNRMVLSDWEEYENGSWGPISSEPSELTIVSCTSTTLVVDGIQNDSEDGVGSLTRVTN
jgi:hypothetical protein